MEGRRIVAETTPAPAAVQPGAVELPPDVMALVGEHAGRLGLSARDWLIRAARAYAKAPATAAERKRASRARKAKEKAK